ncbi:MAG: type II toxin-antitoxin system HicB family antitoxin [Planctomycetota bacterium]|nr:type II toxin-antitoxin system HicB family antitoxin [Planctomycetota bacterium]
MSDKSRKSCRTKTISPPFAPAVLIQARDLADQYQVIVSHEDGEWYGRGLELPRVFGNGQTPAECLDSTREALVGAVAFLLEQGQRPPTPARDGSRTNQVNVRLTAEEDVAGDDMFAEMDPFTVKAGGADYSRKTLYTRMEGE